jgi:hypothetical protein
MFKKVIDSRSIQRSKQSNGRTAREKMPSLKVRRQLSRQYLYLLDKNNVNILRKSKK